ncbi:hypothetical protein BD769DRAFT_1495736 [Suillus cothurnatus]|nr:hypothetical protein BD769DRAFT_1495736 [Suillus cothurnatus]
MANPYSYNLVSPNLYPSHPGGYTSENPVKTSISTPYTLIKETKSQLPELPDDWKPPTEFYAQRRFTFFCQLIVGKPTLEELWQEVRQENGWKKRNDRLSLHFLGIVVGQALVLFTNLAWTMEKLSIENGRCDNYRASRLSSFLFSLMGLLSQVIYIIISVDVENQEIKNSTGEPFKLAYVDALGYIAIFRLTQFNLVYSLALLMTAFGALHLGWSHLSCVTVAVSSTLTLDAILMKDIRRLLGTVWLAIVFWVTATLNYYAVLWVLAVL